MDGNGSVIEPAQPRTCRPARLTSKSPYGTSLSNAAPDVTYTRDYGVFAKVDGYDADMQESESAIGYGYFTAKNVLPPMGNGSNEGSGSGQPDPSEPNYGFASTYYAILYTDGELVFQKSSSPESGRSVYDKVTVSSSSRFSWQWNSTTSITPMSFSFLLMFVFPFR